MPRPSSITPDTWSLPPIRSNYTRRRAEQRGSPRLIGYAGHRGVQVSEIEGDALQLTGI